jgi:hypothetical protein
MTHIDFSPLYVLTGKPPPLTAFTSYVAKNDDIGVTTKLADTPYVAAFIVFIAACGSRSATPDGRRLQCITESMRSVSLP